MNYDRIYDVGIFGWFASLLLLIGEAIAYGSVGIKQPTPVYIVTAAVVVFFMGVMLGTVVGQFLSKRRDGIVKK